MIDERGEPLKSDMGPANNSQVWDQEIPAKCNMGKDQQIPDMYDAMSSANQLIPDFSMRSTNPSHV